MKNFWTTLNKPILALAPMADVTDPAYRKLIAEICPPSVTWTEFVSADGLYHTREKKKYEDNANPLMRDLLYTEKERPIVAQFFTSNPESMEYAARYALEHGFDGVDINMGCPDKAIEKQGAGAGHIKNPEQAKLVIRAAKKGTEGRIPVSVKTRIGYNKVEYEEWLPHILSEDVAALTVHLRTRKEMSKVDAHWELMDDIRAFVRARAPETILLGNGDVKNRAEALEKVSVHGIDGVMLGRAIFGNPWLFSTHAPSVHEKLEAYSTLIEYFAELSPSKHTAILKKHIKSFVSDFDRAAEVREKLYACSTIEELRECMRESLSLV